MLRVLGSRQQLCDGLSRRDLLNVGGLAAFGLTLGDFLRLRAAHAAEAPAPPRGGGFGKAKACILLFLYGSPSQLETFDVKPDAPEEVRGTLGSIATSVPGYRVGELLPHLSGVMDKVTVVRSLTHPYPVHGVAYATTGIPVINPALELTPRDARHWPFVGSVVAYLQERKDRGRVRPVPDNIALPFPFSSRREGEVPRAGPYPAWLGGAYQAHFTEFEGDASRMCSKTLGAQTIEVREPYVGIEPSGRFTLGPAGGLPADLTVDRFARRRSLLDQLEAERRALETSGALCAYDQHRQRACSLIATDRVARALDIRHESTATRAQYGMTLFGQACLAARRLVEAGSRFVTVFWDEYGLAGSAWDTHLHHFRRMKEELCPGFDEAFAGLLTDLDQRGLLDETLVVCTSEHGRTPRLSNSNGGGRDHWSRAYSSVLAGGGVARGRVLGKTDKIASDVIEHPVSPKDILATVYHLLGIDPEILLHDSLDRPLPLVPGARVVHDIVA
jgi:uncharacterized protein (DUF1501 family)